MAGKGRAHQMEGMVPAKSLSSERAGTILTGGVCKGLVWEESGEENRVRSQEVPGLGFCLGDH